VCGERDGGGAGSDGLSNGCFVLREQTESNLIRCSVRGRKATRSLAARTEVLLGEGKLRRARRYLPQIALGVGEVAAEAKPDPFSKLSRYETTIARRLARTRRELTTLQEAREKPE
jgi:hypothetical protein